MKPEEDKPPMPTRRDLERMREMALAHAERIRRLKAAILAGDSLLEHQIAREVCGLPPEVTQ